MKIALCVGQHTVVASVVNVLDVLHAANRHAGIDLFETCLVGDEPPPAWHGVQLLPQKGVRNLSKFDLVLLPAYRGDLDDALMDQAKIIRRLPVCLANGQRVASACSGGLLLAASGLLDGRKATTHWRLQGLAQQRFPRVEWQQSGLIERDGELLTSGGGSAALDLALALVTEQGGDELAKRVASGLLFDSRRGPQSQFFPLTPQVAVEDDLVVRTQKRLQENLRVPHRVSDLAAELHVTPRTLLRRFRAATGMSVQDFTQRLRLDGARALLDNGSIGVEEAMLAVGYEDRASFSRKFKQYFGQGPGAFRRGRAA
ncbi:MAG: helix-turn-helix domain-containing protein [Burkholderiaceae bacterium]|nr:helix-turn-helix domain-containing protein [Burkholderiaceae bacterium]